MSATTRIPYRHKAKTWATAARGTTPLKLFDVDLLQWGVHLTAMGSAPAGAIQILARAEVISQIVISRGLHLKLRLPDNASDPTNPGPMLAEVRVPTGSRGRTNSRQTRRGKGIGKTPRSRLSSRRSSGTRKSTASARSPAS